MSTTSHPLSMRALLFLSVATSAACAGVEPKPLLPPETRPTSGDAPSTNSFALTLPIWVPGVSGHFAKGSTSIDADRPPDSAATQGDRVLTELEFALVGRADARLDRTILYGDFFGVRIAKTADFQVNAADVDASLEAFVGRALVGRRLVADPGDANRTPFDLDLLAGMRGYYVTAQLDSPAALAFDAKEAWLDPIVAMRGILYVGSSIELSGLADIGGFGAGSKLSWSASLEATWNVSKSVGILLGYSVLYVDKGIGRDSGDLSLELTLQGPELGLTIRF
jgi:hypothetical protein